jgi:formate-dependent nitrite reductase membrane component NrfD
MAAGNESAFRSAQLLWQDMGWLIGFIGLGLIVPFLLELKGVIKGWTGRLPIVTASLLVLVGGYLLRHYFMYAGVYAHPW